MNMVDKRTLIEGCSKMAEFAMTNIDRSEAIKKHAPNMVKDLDTIRFTLSYLGEYWYSLELSSNDRNAMTTVAVYSRSIYKATTRCNIGENKKRVIHLYAIRCAEVAEMAFGLLSSAKASVMPKTTLKRNYEAIVGTFKDMTKKERA